MRQENGGDSQNLHRGTENVLRNWMNDLERRGYHFSDNPLISQMRFSTEMAPEWYKKYIDLEIHRGVEVFFAAALKKEDLSLGQQIANWFKEEGKGDVSSFRHWWWVRTIWRIRGISAPAGFITLIPGQKQDKD